MLRTAPPSLFLDSLVSNPLHPSSNNATPETRTSLSKHSARFRPCASSALQKEANAQDQNANQEKQTSAQSQLQLLEQLTSKTTGSERAATIAEQLASKLIPDAEEVVIPLGKKMPKDFDNLTISQKRNIRRQKYLDQVSRRNDSALFATIGGFVLLPPIVILGVAVATGYVDLLP